MSWLMFRARRVPWRVALHPHPAGAAMERRQTACFSGIHGAGVPRSRAAGRPGPSPEAKRLASGRVRSPCKRCLRRATVCAIKARTGSPRVPRVADEVRAPPGSDGFRRRRALLPYHRGARRHQAAHGVQDRVRSVLHCPLDLVAHPGNAGREAGGRSVRATDRRQSVPPLRVSRAAGRLPEPSPLGGDVRREPRGSARDAALPRGGVNPVEGRRGQGSAILRSCLPRFSPTNSRRRVLGAFSRPSCTSTRSLILPVAIHSPRSFAASGTRLK